MSMTVQAQLFSVRAMHTSCQDFNPEGRPGGVLFNLGCPCLRSYSKERPTLLGSPGFFRVFLTTIPRHDHRPPNTPRPLAFWHGARDFRQATKGKAMNPIYTLTVGYS